MSEVFRLEEVPLKRRMALVLGGVAAALVVALVAVGVAAAWPGNGNGDGKCNGTGDGRGYGGGMGPGYATAQQAIADTLGLTTEQLQQERAAGKTVAELAQEKGLALEQIQNAVRTAREATVEDALAAGKMTQERAQVMLQQMEENQARAGECDGTGNGPRAGQQALSDTGTPRSQPGPGTSGDGVGPGLNHMYGQQGQ